jgi:hypothetical protein
MQQRFQYWGICNDCLFNGMLIFTFIPGEDYRDSEAFGYMLEQSCPSCGTQDNVLVPLDEFTEMIETLQLKLDG